MSVDGSDDRSDDDEFVETYEYATDADIIDEEPDTSGEADEEGAVAGSFAPQVEVTPQSPTAENTLFVAVGIYLATLVLGQVVVGDSIYAPQTLVGVTVAIAGATAVCYGILVRTNPET